MCDCGDGPSTYRETRPKARRDHKCCECGGVIRSGETYTSFWGVWDGESSTFKTCADCEALAGWAMDEHDCFCPNFGSLHDGVLKLVRESGLPELIAEGERRVREVRAKRRLMAAA